MQYNIFQNDFYDDKPGIPWAYRMTVLVGEDTGPVLILTKAVKEASVPDVEIDHYQVYYAGRQFLIPTRYKNSGSFSVHLYDDKNLSVYRAVKRIFDRTYQGIEENQTHYSDQRLPVTVKIDILDPTTSTSKDTQLSIDIDPDTGEETNLDLDWNYMKVTETYTFTDCYIESIEDLELDYASEDTVEWTASFKFNGMKVSYPHQSKLSIPTEETEYEYVQAAGQSDAHRKLDTTMRTETDVLGKGRGGYGGGGTEGGGAGGDGGSKGLASTGEGKYGNVRDGIDEHADNTGVYGGKKAEGVDEQAEPEVISLPDKAGEETKASQRNFAGTGTGRFDTDVNAAKSIIREGLEHGDDAGTILSDLRYADISDKDIEQAKIEIATEKLIERGYDPESIDPEYIRSELKKTEKWEARLRAAGFETSDEAAERAARGIQKTSIQSQDELWGSQAETEYR